MVVVVVVRGKIFSVYVMEACMGSRGMAPFIIILGTGWRFGAGIAR
jgi:hypothetical protein